MQLCSSLLASSGPRAGPLGGLGGSHQSLWERLGAGTWPRPSLLCSGLAGLALNLPSGRVWNGVNMEGLLQVRLVLGDSGQLQAKCPRDSGPTGRSGQDLTFAWKVENKLLCSWLQTLASPGT